MFKKYKDKNGRINKLDILNKIFSLRYFDKIKQNFPYFWW